MSFQSIFASCSALQTGKVCHSRVRGAGHGGNVHLRAHSFVRVKGKSAIFPNRELAIAVAKKISRGRSRSGVCCNSSDTRDDEKPFEVPTFLNNTPHARDVRRVFYKDLTTSVIAAIGAGVKRMQVRTEFPELNTEMDVYRVGTMLELIRMLATELAQDGKRVKGPALLSNASIIHWGGGLALVSVPYAFR
ncbi:hypothetical protein CYMTET_29731, partial [Cymbomonas tetramitiformis]